MAKAKKKIAKKNVRGAGVQFKTPANYEELPAKRSYTPRQRLGASDTNFIPVIENILPSYRRAFKPELKARLLKHVGALQQGQSVFIPKNELNIGTVRMLVKEEMKKSFYRNRDIRVVSVFDHEQPGCRIGRYL